MQFHYLSQLDLNLQNENRHSSFAKHVGTPRLLKFAYRQIVYRLANIFDIILHIHFFHETFSDLRKSSNILPIRSMTRDHHNLLMILEF